MTNLEGQVAFITGAARGQGRSHAIRLAEEGADIIAIDLCEPIDSVAYEMPTEEDLADTAKLVQDTGRRIVTAKADVRDRAGLQRALDDGIAELGRLDIVVANAGVMPVLGEKARPDNAWHDAVNVMLTGVYYTCEVAIPTLIKQGTGGSIVITSSTAGLKGITARPSMLNAGMLGYHASKHGVVGLMRAYANALASESIRVNTVHPTGVNTPMVVNEAFLMWAMEEEGVVENFQNALPIPMIEPEDVSNAVAWLCMPASRAITGVALPVDAGFTLR
jgi:SDR family mycofactocin-dependent oxidoreductase